MIDREEERQGINMELIMDEFGQTLLGLLAGGAVIGMFVWVIDIVTAF